MQPHKTFQIFIQTNWYVKYWARFFESFVTHKELHDIKVDLWCVISIRIIESCFIQKQ